MRAAWLCLVVALPAVGAECFRTPAEAAAQVGVGAADGFRLESLQRDALAGRVWARVRSCAHPEQPALLVVHGAAAEPVVLRKAAVAGAIAGAVLRAGARVTVVIEDAASRIEMQGTALANGVVGDQVRVRVDGVSADGAEQVVAGLVRGAGLVEVVR